MSMTVTIMPSRLRQRDKTLMALSFRASGNGLQNEHVSKMPIRPLTNGQVTILSPETGIIILIRERLFKSNHYQPI